MANYSLVRRLLPAHFYRNVPLKNELLSGSKSYTSKLRYCGKLHSTRFHSSSSVNLESTNLSAGNPKVPQISPEILAMEEELTNLRRDFHSHPELAFEEVRTSGIVSDLLKSWGLTVQEIAQTGVVGTLNGTGKKSPNDEGCNSIGLRADMDALPMQEENDFDYISTVPGKFHGCGHDGHTTILLGTAKYLSENRDKFHGTVNFIFQPAEESQGGGKVMVDEGLFERFPCDEIYALHNWPLLKKGELAVHDNSVMASVDEFKITIQGLGGHAAMPHLTVDPILIGSQLVSNLQTLVSRNTNPVDAAVLSVTQFNAGSSYNVIPGNAVLKGTIRSFKEDVRISMKERLHEVAKNTAAIMGGTATIKIYPGYPATVNSIDQAKIAREVAQETFGVENVPLDVEPSMGGEDFSYMLEKVPGCYVWLAGSSENNLHHPKYDFDDSILPAGVQFFSNLITHRLS